MKNTTKLKTWGICQLIVAIILIILANTVFRDKSWDGFARKPNFAMMAAGMFLGVFSLPLIISGFGPQITKFMSKLRSETVDYAGKDIQEAVSKSADTVIPAITPSIKAAVSEIGGSKTSSKEAQLAEAKRLLDNHLISEDEYKSMRKNILNI